MILRIINIAVDITILAMAFSYAGPLGTAAAATALALFYLLY